MDDEAGTWPEQNAVDEWWARHNLELKKLVTSYRIEVQQAAEPDGAREAGLLTALEQIAREVPYQQLAGRIATEAISQYQALRFASQAPAQIPEEDDD